LNLQKTTKNEIGLNEKPFQLKMSYNVFQTMARENPNKYPPRMGMPWSSSEKHNLIMDLKMGKSIERIAAEHQRTVGGINSYRKRWWKNFIQKANN